MTAPIRLFVSSPSDVAAERLAVERVSRRLEGLFEGVQIEVYRWEKDRYYSAHTGFQEQIAEIGGFDLVIGVLWSRLGSPLPQGFGARMPPPREGEPYPSGTAFELLEAIRLRRERQTAPPDIFVYRKLAPPNLASADDDTAQARLLADLQSVNRFMSDFFVNEQEGFKAAFKTFLTLDAFESALEADLTAWLKANHRLGTPRPWRIEERGAPFVGLKAFDLAHRDVFFGRRQEIERARERLEAGQGFLLIDGASGTGKSSLARAGLLPRLTDLDPHLRVAVTIPETETPLLALVTALFGPAAVPDLIQSDYPQPAALARHLMNGGDVAPILRALDRAEDRVMVEEQLEEPPTINLLLLVDQLEGLFASRVPETEKTAYAELLEKLVTSGRVRVIVTLRANMREAALATPALGRLVNANQGLALEPPSADALAEVIRAPAKVAGISFERNAKGIGLDEELLAEVTTDPAALPLLQFALERLYQMAADNIRAKGGRLGDAPLGMPVLTLTHADYAILGGLSGAIGYQADRALQRLSASSKTKLPGLVRSLTESSGGALVLGLAPLHQVAPDDETRMLVETLVEARILVQGVSREGDEPTLRFSHERVLSAWAPAREFAKAAENFLHTRAELVQAEARWRKASRSKDLLLSPGVRLAEAEKALRDFGSELDSYRPQLRPYIEASSRRAVIAQSITRAAAIVFLAVAAVSICLLMQVNEKRKQAEQSRTTAIFALASTMVEDSPAEALKIALVSLRSRTDASPTDIRRGLNVIGAATERLAPQKQIETANIEVSSVAVSADSRLLAAGGTDGSIRVWDIEETDKPSFVLAPRGLRITALSFLPDSPCLVYGDTEGKLAVWKPGGTEGPVQIGLLAETIQRLVVDRTGDRVAALTSNSIIIVSLNRDTVINLDLMNDTPVDMWFEKNTDVFSIVSTSGVLTSWNTTSGEVFEEHSLDSIDEVPWPNAGAVDLSLQKIFLAQNDGALKISELHSNYPEPISVNIGYATIDAISLSSDGRFLYSSSADGVMRVLNIAERRIIREIKNIHSYRLSKLIAAPSGNHLVGLAMDGKIYVWELTKARKLSTVQTDFDSEALRLSFSPDSRLVALSGFGYVALLDIGSSNWLWNTAERWRGTDADIGWIREIEFSPDGSVIAAGNEKGEVLLLDASTGETTRRTQTGAAEPVWDLDFSEDGSMLIGATSKAGLFVWSARDLSVLSKVAESDGDEITAVAVFPSAELFAIGKESGKTILWDVVKERQIGNSILEGSGPVHDIFVSGDSRTAFIHVEGTIWSVDVSSSGFDTLGSFVPLASGEGSFPQPALDSPQLLNSLKRGWSLFDPAHFIEFGPEVTLSSDDVVAISLNGRLVARLDEQGSLSIWETNRASSALEHACQNLPRIGAQIEPLSEDSIELLGVEGATLPSSCQSISINLGDLRR